MRDPRRTARGNLRHELTDIILLVTTAALCGISDWEEICEFGRLQVEWLKKWGGFKKGIPPHDTLSRVFSSMDPKEFNKYFMEWVKEVQQPLEGQLISIDGKTMRGSYDTVSKKKAVHIVSAFANAQGLCLGQVKTSQKGNEVTAIPELLNLLDIHGCIISIDAMGCQKEIVKQVREKKADYLLALKENQKELYGQVERSGFVTAEKFCDKQVDTGHGRVEKRTCTVWKDLRFVDVASDWKDLKTAVKIESERFFKVSGKTERETRYYITSLPADPVLINNAVRGHWGIENKLHWSLDVIFKEDSSRKRLGNQAENYNIIRKIVLAMLKKIQTEKKKSINIKQTIAMLDVEFREKALGF